MTDNDDLRERVARINSITAELIDMKNNKADVHQMAEAAKKLIPGQAVQHITHPSVKGVVGNSVTEGLQVAVTQPDNLDGAICFADPRNLRLAALSATPIEALQQRVERLEAWHDIATAPMDGTPLMLFARCKTATAPCIVIGWYLGDLGWIEAAFTPNTPVGIVPTHWRALPAFPAARAALGDGV